MVLAKIPVIISKMTEGNFVFLAITSNKYEKMIKLGIRIRIKPVFIEFSFLKLQKLIRLPSLLVFVIP